MILLYNIGIFFLRAIFRLAAKFHPKAALFDNGRKNIIERVKAATRHSKETLVWVHCASLGEFEQGRPLIEAMKKQYPAIRILLTFFSPSGYEVRKNYAEADYVFYLPWDTASNATAFVSAINPTVAIFVKYEFWYHYARVLKSKHIPLLSVSSIFRPQQLFFKPFGGFNRRILKNFDYFFVQNDLSLKLLRSIGITDCSIAGDTRPVPIANSSAGPPSANSASSATVGPSTAGSNISGDVSS
jgi:3-deoxy-D-manno-octulosonic-acid transferase